MGFLRVFVGLVGALLTTTSLAAPALASPAQSYQVPALPLDQALRTLARQGRFQILFSAADLPVERTSPLSGILTAEQALQTLTRGQALRIRRLDERTFVILKAPSGSIARSTAGTEVKPGPSEHARSSALINPAEPVAPLPEVTVLGQRTGITRRAGALSDFAETFDAPLPLSQMSRERFEGSMALNITEAIASLPDTAVLTTGRSFISGVDSATRGEGLFVGLRGLNPEFSLVLIDGVPVAQGLPHSRSVQMNMIPPEGFGQVLVHRTGRPDLEGDLIAGAIDFRTLRAQDVPDRRRVEISLSGRLEPLANRYDEPGLGGSQALMLAGRFGDADQLGLTLSLRHETRRTVSSEMAGVMSARNDDGWAWGWSATAGPKYHGTPRDPTRPEQDLVLTALNVGVSEVSSQNRSALLAMDYQPDANVSLRLTLADLGARNRQNSTLSQLVGGARQWIPDPQGGYRLSLGEVSSRVWYQTNPDFVTLQAATLSGRILLAAPSAFPAGSLILTPRLSVSRATSDRPDRIEASIRINQNDRFNTGQSARPFSGQLIVSGKGFPQPVLTPDLKADLDQPTTRLLARRAGQRSEQHSAQTRLQAGLDAEWMSGSDQGLVRFKSGVSFSRSDRDVTDLNWTNAPVAEVLGKGGLTWADLGLTKGSWPAVWPGVYDWRAPRVDHDALVALFWRGVKPESFDRCGKLYLNNLNCGTQVAREQVATAYAMATLREGAFELTGGLRHEQARVRSRFWYMPVTEAGEQTGQWQVSHSRFSVVLPSLFLTWRPDDRAVVRASLWRSYSRPALHQLGGGSWLEVDEPGSVTLTRGNPDLKPILATNLDLQYQRLTRRGGWAISAWHKALDHYMFEHGGSYAGAVARPSGGTRIIMPQNGGKAQVTGLQAEGHFRLSPCFDPQTRFELSASVTRQWSRADLGSDDYGRRTVMQSAPDWLGSATLSYERGPLRLTLQARYTGAFLSDYDTLGAPGDWDNQWIRPVLNTDLSGHVQVSPSTQVEFGVSNLADALSYEAHVGRHSRVISSRVHTGRQFRLGLRARL